MQYPPDLVLFDCDGVLVDTERLTNEVIRDNLAKYGLPISKEDVVDFFVGGTMMGVMETARKLGADLPDNWLDEIYPAIFAELEQRAEPVPGIVDVLDRLDSAGIPYWVGSNGPHAKMDITLSRAGLMDRLKGRILSREDVTNPKPAPDVYLRGAELAGISLDRAVVIEDSPNGARAGKAAGMVTFGFIAETDSERLRPICDQLFDDMRALPELLGL